MPTRVIDVRDMSSQGRLHLYETLPQEKGAYVCLSHCWGGSASFETTKANFDNRKNGFRVDELPHTFQDAVDVTRTLGVRYLWIDAICIVQDSQSDFARETSQMADIYGNAYLTIAATASKDASGGLFRRQKSDKYRGFNTKGYLTEPGVRRGPVFARVRLDHSVYPMDSTSRQDVSKPLHDRAWALQEHYLSPRVASFMEDEIFWTCNSLVACECKPFPGQSSPPIEPTAKVISRNMGGGVSKPLDTATIFRTWTQLVSAYSRKQLSYPSDRLPALSGMAQTVQPVVGGSYLAGLWEKDLLNGLCWSARPQDLSKRPGFRAPTWSWASIDSAVEWATKLPLDQASTPNTADRSLSAYCKPATNDSFGAVKYGWLEATMPMADATFAVNQTGQKRSYLCSRGGDTVEFCADYLLTEPGKYEVVQGERLLLMFLGTKDGCKVHLVLRRYPEIPQSQLTVPVYLRIGLLMLSLEEAIEWKLKEYSTKSVAIL